jgi:sugar/nucleoside kinase (ribokinase family)
VGFDFQLLPPPPTAVRKVTGAGDTLLGSLVWALVGEGVGMAAAVRYGLAGARLALQCDPSAAAGGAVPQGITAQALRGGLADVAQPEEGYS